MAGLYVRGSGHGRHARVATCDGWCLGRAINPGDVHHPHHARRLCGRVARRVAGDAVILRVLQLLLAAHGFIIGRAMAAVFSDAGRRFHQHLE